MYPIKLCLPTHLPIYPIQHLLPPTIYLTTYTYRVLHSTTYLLSTLQCTAYIPTYPSNRDSSTYLPTSYLPTYYVYSYTALPASHLTPYNINIQPTYLTYLRTIKILHFFFRQKYCLFKLGFYFTFTLL